MVNYLIRLILLLSLGNDRIQSIIGSLGDEILLVIDGGSHIGMRVKLLKHLNGDCISGDAAELVTGDVHGQGFINPGSKEPTYRVQVSVFP